MRLKEVASLLTTVWCSSSAIKIDIIVVKRVAVLSSMLCVQVHCLWWRRDEFLISRAIFSHDGGSTVEVHLLCKYKIL